MIKFSELKFEHCHGSDPSKRGYPCTLWVLFHSLTVKQAILAERKQCKCQLLCTSFRLIRLVSSHTIPSDLILSIREFIRHFYQCEECVRHFVNMTSNVEKEVKSYDDAVLYLWQGKRKLLIV